ncbi:MAG: phosphate ABC transporter permease PstA [Gammaproteobacteria bacterium]|nr:phosphate ABC transporter permease PstA [Gammaproteobacteria bacterium]MYD75631.1 phosphate ABC transporter permease PstA [Gammaproteobacteria bacterium]MYJ52365.1 phosphate ABC transporter permease PstA [Gammaproteobacteria bacterium]
MSMKQTEIIKQGLARRYNAERRFRIYGLSAIICGVAFLVFLLGTTFVNGYTAFLQTYIALDITLADSDFDGDATAESIARADYLGIIKRSLREHFPEVTKRRDKSNLYKLVSSGAQYDLRKEVAENPELIGRTTTFWMLADDEVDVYMKGRIDPAVPEKNRRLKDRSIAWIEALKAQDRVERKFNILFFTNGDSREPEQAGILGAVMGSLFAILVTMLLAFPIGVAAAIYLQEFASRNRFTDLIEVNINNLAAVPSIIFGLLGLAIFLNFFNLPRSIPLVGGMVLALMTLPTIIISSRAALAAVPPSIREAALGVGASPVQTVLHHVLPLAMPGMLTGTIIGLAQALGESAPLLVIGMVAFIVDIPGSPLDPGTALPVQIYLWADSPERAFVERTSAAIMVLLLFLVAVNGLIVLLRKKFERRW